jgi:hypothetical protein
MTGRGFGAAEGGPVAHLTAVDGLDLRRGQVFERVGLVDDEAGPGNTHEHAIDDLALARRQLATRHTEIEHLLRGEIHPAVGSDRRVIREFDAGVLRGERVSECLHDGQRRVTSADAVDAGERIGWSGRHTAARGRNEHDHNDSEDEGQGVRE